MQVSFNPNFSQPRQHQLSHKAVIPKYVNEAQRQMKVIKCVNGRILEELIDNVLLFNKISKQDAIDTLLEIKKISPSIETMAEDYIDVLNKC